MLDDTIAAQATANGLASISILRLSGKNALALAKKITKKQNFTPRFAHLCSLHDSKGDFFDEGLVIYFKAPFSFTGEDIVEFQCHGGYILSEFLLKQLLTLGARLAQAGEFSKRAFLNNKMDLSKAEAIASMIESRSEDGLRILAKTLRGDLKNFVEDARSDLLNILAFSEVSIDYAEDDLPKDIEKDIKTKLTNLQIELKNILTLSKRREGLIEGFKVAIIGKPNVGKSSLLNKMLNNNRAIVSEIAGTTRDSIEENIKIGTHLIKIVDTAGIRKTNDFIEKQGVEKSLGISNEADIILAIFDNSKKIDEEDKHILKLLGDSKKDKIFILNKCDLQAKFDSSVLKNPINLSAKEDVSKLFKVLEDLLNSKNDSEGLSLNSQRQINATKGCLKAINEAFAPLEDMELELFSFHINEALEEISSITKVYKNEQMLDVMFSSFCLGK